MSSIVLELQREALANDKPLTDLLRRSLVVAKKLKIVEFETWIKRELDGYGETPRSAYPNYRILAGTPMVWNPYHGWQPIMFEDSKMAEQLSLQPCRQSIAEIEHMVQGADNNGRFESAYPGEIAKDLMQALNTNLRPALHIAGSSMKHILESVRNIVLHWSLQLAEDGILGAGLSFSTIEMTTAKQANYSINNFYGDVNNSQIQQGTSHSKQGQKKHE